VPAGWADQNQNAAMAVSASISLSSSTALWGSDGLVVASSLIAFPPAAWCGPQQPPGPAADHGLCYQQAGCGVGSLLELLTLNGVQGGGWEKLDRCHSEKLHKLLGLSFPGTRKPSVFRVLSEALGERRLAWMFCVERYPTEWRQAMPRRTWHPNSSSRCCRDRRRASHPALAS
jgi:hypothetical protein